MLCEVKVKTVILDILAANWNFEILGNSLTIPWLTFGTEMKEIK